MNRVVIEPVDKVDERFYDNAATPAQVQVNRGQDGGTLVYTPNDSLFVGVDTITYQVTDGVTSAEEAPSGEPVGRHVNV